LPAAFIAFMAAMCPAASKQVGPAILRLMALHSIARRWAALDTEIRALDRDIKTILDTIAAPLLARHGVGYETAGSLLCAAGDNPDRLATEASFAALCGTSLVAVSSGRSHRHRLNRPGDRQANAALWRIVIVRLRSRHTPTTDYLERRVTAGNSKRDAIRCLKRYLARELYSDIQAIVATTEPRSPIAA
jgi:transposase